MKSSTNQQENSLALVNSDSKQDDDKNDDIDKPVTVGVVKDGNKPDNMGGESKHVAEKRVKFPTFKSSNKKSFKPKFNVPKLQNFEPERFPFCAYLMKIPKPKPHANLWGMLKHKPRPKWFTKEDNEVGVHEVDHESVIEITEESLDVETKEPYS